MDAIRLSDAIEAFIAYKKHRFGSTNTTVITYRSNLNDFMKFTGRITVNDLSIDLIDNYGIELSTRGYKPKTFKNKLVVVRSLVRYLYSKNYVNIRPESIDVPRVIPTESNFLNLDEQKSLMDNVIDIQHRAIILTMLRSGLRVSEITELRTDDIFERSIVVRCGKGKKPRVTFISEDAEQAIAAYLQTKKPTVHLFTNNSGEKFSRQYISRIVTHYGTLADTPKHISAHTLRHTFATNMLHLGARIEDVQPMMGHANMQTTRMYMHFTNDYLHKRYDEIMAKSY